MPHGPVKLDNPAFAGTLRYTRRSVSYVPRGVHKQTIQDVAAVRRASPNHSPGHQTSSHAHTPNQATLKHSSVFMDVKPQRRHHHAPYRVVQRTAVLEPRPAKVHHRAKRLRLKRVFHKHTILYAGASLVFIFGMYVGISGMLANRQVATQVKTLQTQAVKGASTGGTTDGSTPPSTEKPSAAAIRSYTVAPQNPRYIDIPSLKVHARVLAMTVDKHNELQSPYGIYDGGWYTGSSLPGQPGAMLVDGHSGIGNTHGIFHELPRLTIGAHIAITRGDGKQYVYTVVKKEIVDASKVDMSTLLVSQDSSKPGLNLITCAGDWIPGTFSLKQRALVYAVMQ